MSGLYNVVFGSSGFARGSLAAVIMGVSNPDEFFPRFRDCFFETAPGEGLVVAIYTRVGGGNRADYAEQIDAMRAHPLYLEDADDEFDSTYAMFRFRLPAADSGTVEVPEAWGMAWPELHAQIMQAAGPRVNMDERWQEALARVGGRA